jgi:hypothetical protein
MHLDALLWLFLPVFVAGGSALLSFYIMQAKLEVAVSKERETLAEAQATISSQKVMMEERIRATEEAVKRAALDEFLKDFRVEERSYVRESKSLEEAKRSMIMQERLFFRNIPLSEWVEHEMVVEISTDLKRLQEQVSVFGGASLPAGSQVGLPTGLSTRLSAGSSSRLSATEGRLPISKLLDDTTVARPATPNRSNSLVPAHAGFGAQ